MEEFQGHRMSQPSSILLADPPLQIACLGAVGTGRIGQAGTFPYRQVV
jgi:hypothetical protein